MWRNKLPLQQAIPLKSPYMFKEKHDTPEFYNRHVSAVASAIFSVKWTINYSEI